jgi:hypothetical protein
VNQSEITAFVIERLTTNAERDPHAWYPATGWIADDGPFGLAIELFGETWSNQQLDQLARVLFRLATTGSIEVAVFRKTGKGDLPSNPYSRGSQAIYGLHGVGSRPLDGPSLNTASTSGRNLDARLARSEARKRDRVAGVCVVRNRELNAGLCAGKT